MGYPWESVCGTGGWRHYLGKEVIVSGQLNQSNQFRLCMAWGADVNILSPVTSWLCVLVLCSNGECKDLQRRTISAETVAPLFLDLDPMQVFGEAWLCGCRAVRCPGSWCREIPLQEWCWAGEKTGGMWQHPCGSQGYRAAGVWCCADRDRVQQAWDLLLYPPTLPMLEPIQATGATSPFNICNIRK